MSNDSLMAEVVGTTTADPIDVAIADEPVSVTISGEPVATEFYLQTTPQLTSASINVTAAGNNVLVAAVAAQVIRVYRMLVVFATADTMYFRDGAAGAALTGTMSMSQYGSIVLDFDGEPWFVTTAGNAFVLNMTAGVQASGRIYYTQG